jgi:hypothetical protein
VVQVVKIRLIRPGVDSTQLQSNFHAAEREAASGCPAHAVSYALLRLVLENALRHKLRTALTVAGIVVAITAFALLRTVIDAWYAGANASSSARLVARNAVLTPGIAIAAVLFALAMGFVGGFLSAARAARLEIVDALRVA